MSSEEQSPEPVPADAAPPDPGRSPRADALDVAYFAALAEQWFTSRTELDRSIFSGSWASIGAILAVGVSQSRISLWQALFGAAGAVCFGLCVLISLRVHHLNSEALMTLIQDLKADRRGESTPHDAGLVDLDTALRSLFVLGLIFTIVAVVITIAPNVYVE